MKRAFARLAWVGVFSLAFCACIRQESTVIHDEERVRVEFENDKAARLFYECLNHSPDRKTETKTTSVDIPIVLSHRRKVVTGPNTAFNRAVELCDSNKDGKITELEARIYSDNFNKRI